jgi:hypothetical protein
MTVFAPTDSAFEKLDPAVRSRLLQGEACVGSKSFGQFGQVQEQPDTYMNLHV